MREILESQEVFEAYAKIDYCYYMLKNISDENLEKRTPLEIMIDEATGFSKAKNKEKINNSIELLEIVIASKKIIDADYENDFKALNKLRELLK